MKHMNRNTEKSFFSKIYVVIALLIAILGLLLYLILSGGADRIQQAISSQDHPAHTVTPDAETQQPDESQKPATADASKTPESSASTEPQKTDEPSASPSEEPSESGKESTSPEPTEEAAKITDDIDSNDSLTKIVSPARTIDPAYVPADLVVPDVPYILDENQNFMRRDAAEAMERMFAAAAEEGHELFLISGYRSYDFQKELQKFWITQKGKKYAAELDSMPGGSEHQLGLAADIGTTDGCCELDVCFAETQAYAWLKENAWKYGYIERYPSGKQEITGITYSPWNFRYVGTDAAERIYHSGKTMEEYYNLS